MLENTIECPLPLIDKLLLLQTTPHWNSDSQEEIRSVNCISWNHLNDNIVAVRQSRNNLVNVNKILIWFSCWLEFRLNEIDLCPENELPHPDWQFKLRCHVVCLLCLFNRASPLTTSIRAAQWTLCGFIWSTMHRAQLRNTRRFHSSMVSSSTYLADCEDNSGKKSSNGC